MHFKGIRCDVCTIEKGETNKWFLVNASNHEIVAVNWNDELAKDERYEHICGESCLQKRISQWAETRAGV